MFIHEKIDDYLCDSADIQEEKIEVYKDLMDDFAEFVEYSETSRLSPADFKDYLLEVFVNMRQQYADNVLAETLQVYGVLRGYSEYLLGRGIFRSQVSQANKIPLDEMLEVVTFLSKGNCA